MVEVCLTISISVAILTLLLIVILNFSKIALRKHFNLNYLFIIGFFIVGFTLFLPLFSLNANYSSFSILQGVALSTMNSIKLFVSGCDFADVLELISKTPNSVSLVYQIWFILLYLLTPLYTIGFILSFFKNVKGNILYFFNWNKDVYVFSSLNEKSYNLAKDLIKNNKKALVVFTGLISKDDKENPYLYSLKELGCLFFYKNLHSIKFFKHSKNKSITFFAIKHDENENLSDGLKIIENYKNRKNTNLYIFSTQIDSELLLASTNKGEVKVRRINEIKSLISRHVYENGKDIFTNAIDNGGKEKEISVLLVGLGKYGTETLKTLTWYLQMDGYNLTINAFDKDEKALEKLKNLCPELLSEKYNGTNIDGEAKYKINVFSGIDVKEEGFIRKIEEIKNVSYAFVCLGQDNLNVETAINLRSAFERIKIHPPIQTIVYNTLQKNSLSNITNYSGQYYDIDYIGDITSQYCTNVILNSELEQSALKQHLKWGEEDSFWNYEYNYSSSIALTMHIKARIFCKIKGADKKTENLTPEENDIIERLEHKRWNAYMRSEGYVYSGSLSDESRNNLAKTHNDLVPFDLLSEEEKRKDSKVGTF